MNYRPRHPGPSISVIYLSDTLIGETGDELSGRLLEAWDALCDENAALSEWFAQTIDSRGGETVWRLDDHLGDPKVRRTKSGNLTLSVAAESLLVDRSYDSVQALMMYTLKLRAEMDGVLAPPDRRGR